MELTAKKPCSFGGRNFFIGERIPAELVVNPTAQEKLGVIAISNEERAKIPDGYDSSFEFTRTFTQEQVDSMIAEAVEEAVKNNAAEMQQFIAELQETASETYVEKFVIPVKTEDGEGANAQYISLSMTPEGVVQVVSVLQSKANEGIEMITNISDENVLILIHALDSRVTVKNAAKKQAGTLTPVEQEKSDIQDGSETTEPSYAESNNELEGNIMPQDGEEQ